MPKLNLLARDINNLTDARFFASWDVRWLAFTLDPFSDSCVSPEKVAAIKAWVEGPLIAGAFGVQSETEIQEACASLGLDAVIAGMFASPEAIEPLGGDKTILKEIVLGPDTDLTAIETQMASWKPFTDYFILDFTRNHFSWEDLRQGQGPVSISWLQACCRQYPVLLAMDLSLSSLPGMLNDLQPAGLCLQGSAEEKTGFKSFDDLDPILEYLQQ